MNSLREVQRAFSDAVLSDDARAMAGLLLENGMGTEDRMRIYRNNARIGFHSALRSTFPVIGRLGGDEWFESVALRYQRQFPSQHGDLHHVGRNFPGFLVEDLAGGTYGWFADVARLEWAYQEVLVAADSPVIDLTALAALSPDEQARLTFTPRTELRLTESRVPVLDIWRANQPGIEAQDLSLDAGPSRVLLLRRADHVEMRELPQGVFELLSAFISGLSLQAATEQLLGMLPDFELGASLRRLVELETLSALRIHPVV